MSDVTLNGEVCNDLLFTTQTLYDLAFDNTVDFDP